MPQHRCCSLSPVNTTQVCQRTCCGGLGLATPLALSLQADIPATMVVVMGGSWPPARTPEDGARRRRRAGVAVRRLLAAVFLAAALPHRGPHGRRRLRRGGPIAPRQPPPHLAAGHYWEASGGGGDSGPPPPCRAPPGEACECWASQHSAVCTCEIAEAIEGRAASMSPPLSVSGASRSALAPAAHAHNAPIQARRFAKSAGPASSRPVDCLAARPLLTSLRTSSHQGPPLETAPPHLAKGRFWGGQSGLLVTSPSMSSSPRQSPPFGSSFVLTSPRASPSQYP